jgi:hypothetical protein
MAGVAFGMTFLLPRAKPAEALDATEDMGDDRLDLHLF